MDKKKRLQEYYKEYFQNIVKNDPERMEKRRKYNREYRKRNLDKYAISYKKYKEKQIQLKEQDNVC